MHAGKAGMAHLCFSSCVAAVSFLAAMRSQNLWSKLMMFSATSLPSCRHRCWPVSSVHALHVKVTQCWSRQTSSLLFALSSRSIS